MWNVGTGEVKRALLADGIAVHVENPKGQERQQKFLNLISGHSNITGSKVNIHESVTSYIPSVNNPNLQLNV